MNQQPQIKMGQLGKYPNGVITCNVTLIFEDGTKQPTLWASRETDVHGYPIWELHANSFRFEQYREQIEELLNAKLREQMENKYRGHQRAASR